MTIQAKNGWERVAFPKAADSKDVQPAELYRLRVPMGWLVAAGWGTHPGPLTFVPDPEWTWTPETDPPVTKKS
jgi:hypothetical protein